eukprot:jgi/Botrbrau1/10093/Bobra.20_2s0001.1
MRCLKGIICALSSTLITFSSHVHAHFPRGAPMVDLLNPDYKAPSENEVFLQKKSGWADRAWYCPEKVTKHATIGPAVYKGGPVPVGMPKVFPVFIGKTWVEKPAEQAFMVAALQALSGSSYLAPTRLFYEMVCPAEYNAAPIHLNASGLITYGGSGFYTPPEGASLSDAEVQNILGALFSSYALPQLPNAMYIVLLDKTVQWNDTQPGRGSNCFCGYAGSMATQAYTNPLGLVAYSVNQHPESSVCKDEAAHETGAKGSGPHAGPSACWPQAPPFDGNSFYNVEASPNGNPALEALLMSTVAGIHSMSSSYDQIGGLTGGTGWIHQQSGLPAGILCCMFLIRNNTLSPLYKADNGAVWNVELMGTRYLLPPTFVNLPCPAGAQTLDAGCLPVGGYCATGVDLS